MLAARARRAPPSAGSPPSRRGCWRRRTAASPPWCVLPKSCHIAMPCSTCRARHDCKSRPRGGPPPRRACWRRRANITFMVCASMKHVHTVDTVHTRVFCSQRAVHGHAARACADGPQHHLHGARAIHVLLCRGRGPFTGLCTVVCLCYQTSPVALQQLQVHIETTAEQPVFIVQLCMCDNRLQNVCSRCRHQCESSETQSSRGQGMGCCRLEMQRHPWQLASVSRVHLPGRLRIASATSTVDANHGHAV